MPKVNTFSTGHENLRPATERYQPNQIIKKLLFRLNFQNPSVNNPNEINHYKIEVMEGDDLVQVATNFIQSNGLDPNLSNKVYQMIKRAYLMHQEK